LLQIKTIWSLLFRTFDFELVSPMPTVNYEAIVAGPHHPCVFRYKRKPSGKEFEVGSLPPRAKDAKVESKSAAHH